MPIYDYQCGSCGHRFEQLVSRGEVPACPACGAAHPAREFPTSAAVSTVRMRERSLSAARGKAGAVKKEKDHAHAAYLREHAKDHGG